MNNGVLTRTPADVTGVCLELLGQVLAVTRFLVGEKVEHRSLYAIMDRVEFLPSLLISPDREKYETFMETIGGLKELNDLFRDVSEQAIVALR